MGFENRAEKKETGPLQERINAQSVAYREMRDAIGAATDHVSTHMKGLLNTWSAQESRAKKPDDVQRHVSSDLKMLFEAAREQLSKEMNTPEDAALRRAEIKSRTETFAAIARKYGFDVDQQSL